VIEGMTCLTTDLEFANALVETNFGGRGQLLDGAFHSLSDVIPVDYILSARLNKNKHHTNAIFKVTGSASVKQLGFQVER
jgi:hypothetical protein